MSNCIALESLSKSFGSKVVLEDIKLQIPEGEFFGLLGPSGAGKTTLIKILTGQIGYQGTAKVFDENCKDIGREIYSKVGMVLDNCGIYERISCYNNLVLFCKLYGVPKSEIKVILKKVGLDKVGKMPAGRMSKGQKQRLLLARAVLHKPKLLFLDEPTSGLDPMTVEEIHNYLLELKSQGTTIFLTTHNMTEAYQMCDKIALLNEGHIVEYGVPEEICRKYNKENMITILCKDGKEIVVPNKPDSAATISSYFEANKVEAIHSSEPNLETVFKQLTGRGLS